MVVSEKDAAAVRRTVPGSRVTVIPYAVDTDHYRPTAVSGRDLTIAFHGHLGYAPNIDAVLELVDSILPLVQREEPNVVFHLVAAEPVARIRALAQRPGITLTISPPDVRVPLSTAQVYACPIRHGTGMKTKVLEALALGLPIVCYPASVAGIDCTDEQVRVVHDPQAFAAAVVCLLRHPERARAQAAAGRALVKERYSWEGSAGAFERLYEEAIASRRRLAVGAALPQARPAI